MKGKLDFITVVIPTYNRKSILEKCLKAFAKQSYPVDRYEIIVVDDGSTDGTKELLAKISENMPNLRYLSQAQSGPAKVRNLGITKAKGPIVLFTGDDCIPDKKLLEEHNRIHQKERNVAVLGHIEWHPDLEISPFMKYVGISHQFSFPVIEDEKLNVSFYFFYTSNISIAKDMLIKANLFDEDFKDAVCEDVEMGYRLWKSGLRIVYNRRALTYHYHTITLKDYIKRQILQGKAIVILYQKHPEISDILKIEDVVSPEISNNFYDSVLRYYSAVGMQIGLKQLKGKHLYEDRFMVPLKDILDGWSAKISDRLFSRLKHEALNTKRLAANHQRELSERSGELQKEREKSSSLEEGNRALDEKCRVLKGKNMMLEKELEHWLGEAYRLWNEHQEEKARITQNRHQA